MWTETARVRRQLPFALLATSAVVLLPPVIVTLLAAGRGSLFAVAACVALSLIVSRLAAAGWRRLPRSQDVLFADLMLWGWLQRLRTENRLRQAGSLCVSGSSAPSPVEAARRQIALERVTAMIESRDAYTHRHSLRVTRHCEGIARQLGLADDEVARIRAAAALHDVGKFFTPRPVLNKPGRLTEAEFDVIKRHPGQGADLVKGVVDPEIVAMIRHHHERLGGTGYPDGLAGDAIPLGARIIAVADTFDAMTSTRAYRSARPHQRALDVLREEAGVALDASAVEAFGAYYSGRRGVYWSTAATALAQALAPLRELAGPALLSRTLPALGASVALTAPMLTGGTQALSAGPATGPAAARAPAAGTAKATAGTSPFVLTRLTDTPRAARRTTAVDQSRSDGRPRSGTPRPGTRRPGTPRPGGGGPQGSGQVDQAASADRPAATTSPGQGKAPEAPSGAAPASSTAPAPSAPAEAPAVAVDPAEVEVGGTTVKTPPVTVDLPALPLKLPPIEVELPPLRLPR